MKASAPLFEDTLSSSTTITATNPAHISALAAVPYYGFSKRLTMDHPKMNACRLKLEELSAEYKSLLKSLPASDTTSRLCWEGLVNDVESLFNAWFSLESPPVPLYKLQLLEGLLPYLQKLGSRQGSYLSKNTDKNRFAQVQRVLYVLGTPEEADSHPAHCLVVLESVRDEIGSKALWFSSDLKRALDLTLERQWNPILTDNQRLLNNLAGRLMALGTIEVVGRPVLMLYPLYIVVMEVYKVIQMVQTVPPGKRVSMSQSLSALVSIAKAMGILLVVNNIMGMLSHYQALGRACLGVGTACVGLANNRTMLKQTVPSIAPAARAIATVVQQAYNVESKVIGWLSKTNTDMQHALQNPPTAYNPSALPAATSSSTSSSSASAGGAASLPMATAVPVFEAMPSAPMDEKAAALRQRRPLTSN